MEVVAPVFQRYLVPPLAVSVALDPVHIVKDGEAVIVGVGSGLTVTVFAAATVHPFALATVTVYAVVVVGLTLIAEVVSVVFQL